MGFDSPKNENKEIRIKVLLILGRLKRQSQARFASPAASSILKRQRAAVRFGDLATQDESDAGTAGLGGKERHKEIRGVGEARPFVLDVQFKMRQVLSPTHFNRAARLRRSVYGVAHKINQQLLQLIGVRLDDDSLITDDAHLLSGL